MVPIAKDALQPATLAASRGVLVSSCPGKAYAAALRAAIVPYLPLVAGEQQQGAIRGRSLEYASHSVRLFFQWAGAKDVSSAVIFADLKAALYSVMPEYVLGALLTSIDRERLFINMELGEEARATLEGAIAEESVVLSIIGLPEVVRRAVADWHMQYFFTIQGLTQFMRTRVWQRDLRCRGVV